MYGVSPRKGRLVALSTKAEIQAKTQIVEAYTTIIPLKSASTILKAIDGAIRELNLNPANLQHLRRYVKAEHLPVHLQDGADNGDMCNTAASALDTNVLYASSVGDNDQESATLPILHFLICATSTLPKAALLELLSSTTPFKDSGSQPRLRSIPVPLLPPTTDAQAKHWSQHYWPTIYKKNNPFGPHPSLVSRATAEIELGAREYMALALLAGKETSDSGVGEYIGAVVVDRSRPGQEPSVVVAAGDARWNNSRDVSMRQGNGNAMAHAVMRAIGLVARKRRDLATYQQDLDTDFSSSFADTTLTPLEHMAYNKPSLEPGGYLCHDLEIYVSHEPCVMCCMAILHSRFGRVVIGSRMMRTGGLTAEGGGAGCLEEGRGLGYGIFWEPRFNWKFLAWQWVDEEEGMIPAMSERDVHA